MTNITPMPTRHHAAAEAARQTQAVAAATDSAALAAAELVRQLRAGLFGYIEASRSGRTREELHQFCQAGELVDTVLAAMLSDGAIELHGACYRTARGAA